MDLRNAMADLPSQDQTALTAARQRNDILTKPPGALGRLEELAVWYAGWRGEPRPAIVRPQVAVFAGNHGVTARGVSAFPAEVTAQMVANFQAGGAAINQLSALHDCAFSIDVLDLDTPTADFTTGPAMSETECAAAFAVGWKRLQADTDLLIVGEMGIGNTTAAAAVAAALFGGSGADWVGRGTGVDAEGLARKAEVVDAGLQANPGRDPFEVLQCLGGRELAAMAGAIAHARKRRVPVILDGFICTAAAAVLHQASPDALDHAIAGHVSDEQAHARLLGHLDKEPLLAMNMRLGEGSGAALALGVLQGAIACHSGMATFEEAGVSGA